MFHFVGIREYPKLLSHEPLQFKQSTKNGPHKNCSKPVYMRINFVAIKFITYYSITIHFSHFLEIPLNSLFSEVIARSITMVYGLPIHL